MTFLEAGFTGKRKNQYTVSHCPLARLGGQDFYSMNKPIYFTACNTSIKTNEPIDNLY